MQQMMIQIIMAFIGVVGFSIMFNIHGHKVIFIGIGGAICWVSYTIILGICGDKIISCFAVTVLIAMLAEIFARIFKTPVILLLVPMLVPLMPGSDLYYMMSAMVLGNTESGRSLALLLAGEAGAIAFGIIIVTTVTQITVRTLQYITR